MFHVHVGIHLKKTKKTHITPSLNLEHPISQSVLLAASTLRSFDAFVQTLFPVCTDSEQFGGLESSFLFFFFLKQFKKLQKGNH